mgnify:CR=1 FL=1|jgi:hypothetical protein
MITDMIIKVLKANNIDSIVAVPIVWLLLSILIGVVYTSKRWTVFDLEEGHLYVADILVGLICLPVTIIVGLCLGTNKLIHIKIK